MDERTQIPLEVGQGCPADILAISISDNRVEVATHVADDDLHRLLILPGAEPDAGKKAPRGSAVRLFILQGRSEFAGELAALFLGGCRDRVAVDVLWARLALALVGGTGVDSEALDPRGCRQDLQRLIGAADEGASPR